MAYKSAKEFFAAANGKTVRKVCTGVATVDQWPAIRADIIAQLIDQGANPADIESDCDKVAIGSQFWRAPKVVGDETGTLTVRSADYAFQPLERESRPIYGDKKGCKVIGDSLVKTYENGMIVTFTIETE